MKVEIKKLKQANIEIDCQMEWQEFFPYYEKTLSEVVSKAEIKGFRAGRAPKDIVEQKVGDFKILETAAEIALQENYLKIIKENNLEVIGPPQVEILKLAKANEFQAKIKIDILPEIKLPDYQKIVSKVAKKKTKVEDKEIEETIKWIQKSRANMQETENKAVKGNWVEIVYQSPQIEEKLKENIKQGLFLEKENQQKEIWKDDILKAISDEIKIEMPEILVLSEKKRILRDVENKTEEIEKEALEMANKRVKNYLILREIGKKEGIEVLEQEFEQEINKFLASYPQLNPQEIDKEAIKGVLYNNKVFEALERFCDK